MAGQAPIVFAPGNNSHGTKQALKTQQAHTRTHAMYRVQARAMHLFKYDLNYLNTLFKKPVISSTVRLNQGWYKQKECGVSANSFTCT